MPNIECLSTTLYVRSERDLGGTRNSAVAITNKKQITSDAIMSDTVGYSGRLPGKDANFSGTITHTIGNTVHAFGIDSPMTTEFIQAIQFNKGVVKGVSETPIEPGDPRYR